MSAESQQVTVPTPSGERRTGELVEEAWQPTYNDQDCDMVRVDVDGTTLRVRAEEVEEL